MSTLRDTPKWKVKFNIVDELFDEVVCDSLVVYAADKSDAEAWTNTLRPGANIRSIECVAHTPKWRIFFNHYSGEAFESTSTTAFADDESAAKECARTQYGNDITIKRVERLA